MLKALRRESPSTGAVYFRGNLAPRAEEFAFLQKQGITLKLAKAAPEGAHWSLKADHPAWGPAEIASFKDTRPPPAWILDFAPGLTKEERAEAAAAGVGISILTPAAHNYTLRDRKNLLRYLHAVMNGDGVVALDTSSTRFWSRRALEDELAHDADLDVSALYTIQAVTPDNKPDGPPTWVHTHGLAEAGAFDLDILGPSQDGTDRAPELIRAMAFAALAGDLEPAAASFELARPGGSIRLVSAQDFHARAAPADAALRDNDEHHSTNRSVVCDPGGGFLSRWRGRVRPARFLAGNMPEQMVMAFSHAATDLMAERARKTLSVLSSLIPNATSLDLPILAKIGYKTDHAKNDHDREHLWFRIHAVDHDGIDATLESQPFDIARMNRGDRGLHSVDQLTEWLIITPMGHITPSSLGPARLLRENPEAIKAMMAMFARRE